MTIASDYSGVLEKTREYIRILSARPSNMMSEAFYSAHILLVEKHGSVVCSIFGARPELFAIAALIHDVSAITDYSLIAEHHLKGAEQAAAFLGGKLSAEEIAIIADAIRNHNFPIRSGSPEAIALSQADGLSKFDSPLYWVAYGWKHRADSIDESVSWYLSLLEQTYEQLDPGVRGYADAAYPRIRVMLDSFGS